MTERPGLREVEFHHSASIVRLNIPVHLSVIPNDLGALTANPVPAVDL